LTSLRARFPGADLGALVVAVLGSSVAVIGTIGLSFLEVGLYVGPGYCPVPCPARGPFYSPYIPTFLIAVVLVAAIAPLLVSFVRRFWWAGVVCSLGGVGVPGAVWLTTSAYAPGPVQPLDLALLSWMLVIGAAVTAVGLTLLRPPRAIIPLPNTPPPHSNGAV
jgi:hypothetical protein